MWRYLGTRIWPGGWICYNSVCSLFRYSFGMWRPWSPLFHMNLNMLQQANWKCENFLITTALMESTNTGCWTMCIFFLSGHQHVGSKLHLAMSIFNVFHPSVIGRPCSVSPCSHVKEVLHLNLQQRVHSVPKVFCCTARFSALAQSKEMNEMTLTSNCAFILSAVPRWLSHQGHSHWVWRLWKNTVACTDLSVVC